MVGHAFRSRYKSLSDQCPLQHYADLPTDEFRARFGRLAFSSMAGTTVVLADSGPLRVPRDKIPTVLGDDAVLYQLPADIMKAGGIRLTAAIHTLSAANNSANNYWDTRKLPDGNDQLEWPEQFGGTATIGRIFDRCRAMREPGFQRDHQEIDPLLFEKHPDMAMHLTQADPVLRELFAPEQQRQQTEIVKAIDRVYDAIR